MPVIFKIDRFKVSIHADDHAPPHVHVNYKDIEIVVDLRNLAIMHMTKKVSRGDLRAIMAAIKSRQAQFLDSWENSHG